MLQTKFYSIFKIIHCCCMFLQLICNWLSNKMNAMLLTISWGFGNNVQTDPWFYFPPQHGQELTHILFCTFIVIGVVEDIKFCFSEVQVTACYKQEMFRTLNQTHDGKTKGIELLAITRSRGNSDYHDANFRAFYFYLIYRSINLFKDLLTLNLYIVVSSDDICLHFSWAHLDIPEVILSTSPPPRGTTSSCHLATKLLLFLPLFNTFYDVAGDDGALLPHSCRTYRSCSNFALRFGIPFCGLLTFGRFSASIFVVTENISTIVALIAIFMLLGR